jgi:ADP-ribose pyrophosphatase YjhB (NUDIX family)
MPAKKCDHKSVGMLVWDKDKLLLIERAVFPFGFSIPAGHVDDDLTFEDAAKRELKEEVGLDATKLELILDVRKENICRREDGTWHHWNLYKVDATGKISRSLDETKSTGWFTREEIQKLDNENRLEPIMHEFFQEVGITLPAL